MSKWQQHVECKRIIQHHPDWTDAQVAKEAGMRPMEINIVQEARREVVNESRLPGSTQSDRSY